MRFDQSSQMGYLTLEIHLKIFDDRVVQDLYRLRLSHTNLIPENPH